MLLLHISAWPRLPSPSLPDARRAELAELIARGELARPCGGAVARPMRLGIADHLGWAVAVTS